MNEIIKDLRASAFAYATVNSEDYFGDKREFNNKFDDKFSELIIQECLDQMDKMRDACEASGDNEQALGVDWAGLAIARHFGVEE